MDDFLNLNADTIPPRYAIESDDEDELNPIHTTITNIPQNLDINILGNVIPPRGTLVIATGDAGLFWARGANLGEQTGAISVNSVQVGLIFHPFWTTSTIIISEALSRLPSWAMHPYSQYILKTLNPTRISLLDVYSVPTYITQNPLSIFDAPIRFLSTSSLKEQEQEQEQMDLEVFQPQPFSPPNLINSTSSSILSILQIQISQTQTQTQTQTYPTSLFLLPSPNIPKPPPPTIQPSNFSHLTQDTTEWPSQIMNQVHQLLFESIGDDTKQQWELDSSSKHITTPSHARQVGDGGMYI